MEDEANDTTRYMTTLAVFGAAVGGTFFVGGRKGARLPDELAAKDLILGGLAAHKLSRLISREAVTSPLRAPFTSPTTHEPAAESSGARRTVGELFTCPFCLGMWAATGITAGLVLAPRVTRLATSTLAMLALSDFLQYAHTACARHAD
ncbi:DUF1360 domain-containing protein [Embleya scabrispora]|nr:DUF1360 domain-containing protein [Embleya scabrispora]